jgi:hypothetical protein
LDITPPVGAIMTGPRLPVSVGTDAPLFAGTLVIPSGDRSLRNFMAPGIVEDALGLGKQ